MGLIYFANILGGKSSQFSRRYPSTIDCEDIEGNFDTIDQFKETAITDKPFALQEFGRGQYACYCSIHGDGKNYRDDKS